ncbi:rab11 family-interacting protein 4 isoform X2 [Orussus abietinus]|uniref:rab11 family-interacting protein 4 isoform X2 n=1 Tax=Orussus abietinus TaxID=222816 RepID=UPI000625F3FE|nr:rab11 family-interacting protein 4 isoform X2 [Orussus abietinus]
MGPSTDRRAVESHEDREDIRAPPPRRRMVSSRAPTVNVGGRAADSEADERATGGENADHLLTCNGDAPADQSRVADSADLRIGGAPRPPTSAGEDWSQSGPPSLSMSVDLHNLVSSYGQEAGSPPDKGAPNEEEESYEGFGYVRVDGDESPGGSSSAPSPTGANSFRNPRSPNSTIGRHSWLRTSLRRTPPCTNKKRLSSNALASQLYRSSSFNSSGRGSTCDNTEDMYSDVSLEDDVLDLNHRVQMIQEQMHALVDTQSVGEERYARVKQENATLQARILMLEESAKDAEARAEERLQAEQRRHREWVSRLERERQLQLENYAIKLQAVETESSSLRDEVTRLREQLERVRADKSRLEGNLEELRTEIDIVRESERQAISRANEAYSLFEEAKEELAARVEDRQRIDELVQQVARLRARNKSLEESRDELQAAAALQAGRELLMLNPCGNGNNENGPSLAAELLEGMNQDQADGQTKNDPEEPCTISEMRKALKEQQEVNTQLRAYIDGILLNIVDNYPQLLEVKQGH